MATGQRPAAAAAAAAADGGAAAAKDAVTSSSVIRYDTRCYFNVRSKANMSQLNLPHGTDN